jgi:ABC-2 type transport system permease protein
MRNVLTIFRRELIAYFATPLAYVFIVIFLVMAGILTFFVGNFFERGQADLQPFFTFHPWLYIVLIPALSMRLWAEERRSGTIELFLTLPIRMTEAVAGKFLAAWCFAGPAISPAG